jgi:hypothetical protein
MGDKRWMLAAIHTKLVEHGYGAMMRNVLMVICISPRNL